MSRNHVLRGAIRHATIVAAISASFVAQAAEEKGLNEVIVTGSRIMRSELDSSVPIISVGQEDFDNRGLGNIADLSTTLPEFSPAFGSSRTQSTFSGSASSGLNTINLRNLGDVRSLILINGRRIAGGTSTSTRGDMNMIPTANIERIEIVTGGASAIYGSDAVAGVVNIITKKNFTGIEAGLSYSITQEGDNKTPKAHLMYGADFGENGRMLATIQYVDEGHVSCKDRYLCAEDFAWTSPPTKLRGPAAYSAVAPGGRFFTPTGAALAPGQPPVESATRRGGSMTSGGALIPFDVTVDGYNRNPDRDLAIPTKRALLALEGEYGIGDILTVFGEFNYGKSETDSSFEAHPFQSQQAGSLFGGGPGVAGLQATIPVSNPFVPAALRAYWVDQVNGQITWAQRFRFDNRGADNEREMIRGVAGIKGEFDSLFGLGSGWTWEVSYMQGNTTLESLTEGSVGTDRLYYGLRVEPDPANPGQYRCIDANARAAGCIPINPFAEYTPAMINYLSVNAGQHGTSKMRDAQAYLSGAIVDLPAGALQSAVGVEWRSFSGFLDYDSVINNALVTGNQIGDVDFVQTISKEAYVEMLVPLLKEKPGAENLSVEGAFRRSETERTDNYNTWKYGTVWEPITGLRFRGMRARAVRAPIPGDLSGIGQTFGTISDPCTQSRRNNNPTRAANCTADGVPSTYNPPLSVEQGVAGFTGGNPNLDPEEAQTMTYGVTWAPAFLPDFTLSVDRFDINIEGVITTVARQSQANLCYDSTPRLFCASLTRGTHPQVAGANYVLLAVNEQSDNVAALDVSGYDIAVAYAFGIGSLGRLKLDLLMTIYDRADLFQIPGQPATELLGFAGGSTSDQGFIRKTARMDIGHSIGKLSTNWNIRYIGRTGMSPFLSGYPEVGSHFYHNLAVRYTFDGDRTIDVYGGVNNVFNKEPPFFATSSSGTQALDTIPGYYDIFGRTFFAGMRVRF